LDKATKIGYTLYIENILKKVKNNTGRQTKQQKYDKKI
jgi:hypothetical protein